ncbi:tetraspanin-9-like isoform X2 [Tribolium madens]|nr:tetraspanin-9-like isoform X2 [Tribolium madens]
MAMIVWAVVDKILDSEGKSTTFTVWMLVGVGSMLNASLGLYGTKIDDNCLVYASIIFLFVTCISQILVTIIRIAVPHQEAPKEKERFQKMFNSELTNLNDEFHKIEIEWQCCGVLGFDDYEEKFDPVLVGYPPSCCESGKRCQKPYPIGCHTMITHARFVRELIRAIIFITFSVLKFCSAIVIAVLTIWHEEYFREEKI